MEMVARVTAACHAHISNINTPRSIYCAYFHCVIKYGIIFGVILPKVGRFSL
jgi:hypothetical protein